MLVGTGEDPKRPGDDCKEACPEWHARLMADLRRDVGEGGTIDALWITHQHSDHLGGAPDVLQTFHVGTYVDNGRDPDKRLVDRAHKPRLRITFA